MYQKILVPVDGSTLSEGVLPYVRSLARALHVPVELLCVRTRARADTPPLKLDDYLDKVAASFSGITAVTSSVEVGYPAAVIVDRAAGQVGALIAMATRGLSGPQRWLLGSVAEKVLQATTNPLLLVRPEGRDSGGNAGLKTILAPLDGSELAEKALPTVSELAACLKLETVLVHVLIRFYFGSPDALLPVFGASAASQQQIWAESRAAASQYLAEKAEELRARGLPGVTCQLIEDAPEGAAAAIIDLARKTADDLVIMSTHGRSGIGRWLLGSVTERVVRYTSNPVLIIRPQS